VFTFLNSLRFRLMLLVLLAGLPGMGLIVYNGMEQRRDAQLDAQERAARFAGRISSETDQAIKMTHQLMVSLAQFPAVIDRDLSQCPKLLESLQKIHPFYQVLLVTDAGGETVCASYPGYSSIPLGDRDYFQRAITTRDFVISDFLVGRMTGKPAIACAYPVISGTGELQGVVIATIDLSWLVRIASAVQLPAGSSVNIVDSSGTILARWPDPERWIGRSVAQTEIGRIVLDHGAGTAESIGLEGIPRLYGFQPLLPDKRAGYVYVGIPRELAFAPVNRVLAGNLIALGGVLILGLAAALFFGQVFIMRGVTTLVDTTQQLSSGDLSARTAGRLRTGGEIGQLAVAFDKMAESLQQREAERKKAEEEIRRSAATARLQADISEEFIKAGPDFGTVLPWVAECVTKWFEDACFIHLLTEEGDISEESPVYYSSPDSPLRINTPTSLSDSGGLALLAEVVRTSDSIVIPMEDPHSILAGVWERLECQSLLVVPMRADEEVIGTLTLIRDRPEEPHTVEDESLAQYIADRAAVSIAKARLIEMIHRLNAELEERVNERTAQLMAANKELEAFAYSVSHDLRAPLRAIDGFSRILLEKYDPVLDSKGSHYLQRTRSAAQRMGQLIDDLLSLSRLTRKQMQWTRVDLTSLCLEIEAELRESQPDRAVDFIIQSKLAVPGDGPLLRAALENLLGNAWKFTGNSHRPRIEFGMVSKDNESVFFVSDNGAGFDMEYADQLFGAFQRLHSMTEYPGTGIGLAIVQRVIHRHGGTIWANGSVGKGATFYFKLPKGGDF
jgi:signal transduction histidine kinase/HAMP domain-containing protein